MEGTGKQTVDEKEIILNEIPEFIIYVDPDRRILWANIYASQLVGKAPEDLVGKQCADVFGGNSDICSVCPIAEVLKTRIPSESEFISPDGRVWSMRTYPVLDDNSDIKGIIETRSDITSRKISDESIKETKELFKLLAESAKDLIFRYHLFPAKGFDYISPSSIYITGYSPEEFYAQKDLFFNILHADDQKNVKDQFEKTDTLMPLIDFRLIKKDGTILWLELQLAPKYDIGEKLISIQGIGRDITEWRQEKERQRMLVKILEVLNEVKEKKDRIMLILLLIKDYTGFEAVGIRLKEGDDFPYYETNGFEAGFVEAERYLCARDGSGEILRDSMGNTFLECLCGSVLTGKIDHTLPNYTKNGSFWTNSKPDLDALSKKGTITGLRGRCFREGYESMALIPLRSENEIIGLLQLNEKRKNMITPEMVSFFEGVAASIGIAFRRNIIEEEKEKLIHQLKESLDKVKVLSGLLPICANCKKIRDDKGHWNTIENYIKKHSDADFTHGICPECAQVLYPKNQKKDKSNL